MYNDNLVNDTCGVGISISNQITIDSLQTSNVLFGVLMWEVNDVIIHNSSFQNCHYSGLYILETNHIKLISNHSGGYGIILSYTRYSLLENLNITLSGYYGLLLDNCADTRALKISSQDNYAAVIVWFSKNTTIINVLSMNNQRDGVLVRYSTNTAMTSISSVNNQDVGVSVLYCTSTTLTNISSMNSYNIGVNVFGSTDTIMKNVASIDNQHHGINVQLSNNTTMINISSINNKDFNIYIENSKNTEMMNILSSMNVTSPKGSISLRLCSNMYIQNISVLVDDNIDYSAIYLSACTDVLLEDNVFSGITSDLQQVTTNVVHLLLYTTQN